MLYFIFNYFKIFWFFFTIVQIFWFLQNLQFFTILFTKNNRTTNCKKHYTITIINIAFANRGDIFSIISVNVCSLQIVLLIDLICWIHISSAVCQHDLCKPNLLTSNTKWTISYQTKMSFVCMDDGKDSIMQANFYYSLLESNCWLVAI